MPGIFYPRHVLRIVAVLETFDGGAATVDRAVEWQVIPRAAKLERNDVHTADRLTITVDFREFPFDPRLVRAATVIYYAGNTRGEALPLTRATLRFLGVVDTPESYLSEDAQTVTFECRDYTAVLLEKRATPQMAVALDRPLDVVLRELLATLPGAWGQTITPTLEAPPDVDIAWPIVPGGGRTKARLPVEPKDTLWSVIRRVVEAQGLVAFIDLDNLVVSPSRTIGPTGALLDAPRLHVVFGENLADLRLKRAMNNRGRPVVLAQYDPRTGDTTRSEWPRPEDRARAGRSRSRGRQDVVVRRTGGAQVTDHDDSAEEFVVTGDRTGEQLSLLAESIHRKRNQFELEGSFTTHDPVLPQVTDGGEAAADFDLWSIHTATTLYADIADHAIAFDTLRTRADKERYLTARGYDPVVAAALVTSWAELARVSLALPFIVRKATLSLDGDAGFRAEVDFQAMLTPQALDELAPGRATPPTSRTITVPDATLVRGR